MTYFGFPPQDYEDNSVFSATNLSFSWHCLFIKKSTKCSKWKKLFQIVAYKRFKLNGSAFDLDELFLFCRTKEHNVRLYDM